jgi:hypothetical protein
LFHFRHCKDINNNLNHQTFSKKYQFLPL